MKILLLSLYYRPDTASTGRYMAQLARSLSELGHEVTVVTTAPHYKRPRLPDEYRGRLYRKEVDDGVEIWRNRVVCAPEGASALRRVANYGSYHLTSTVEALCVGQPDVVMATSPPLTTGLTARLTASLRGVPYVYAVQDVWPDVLVDTGYLDDGAVVSGLERVEGLIYDGAAAVTVLSGEMRRTVERKEVPPRRVEVIPSAVDTDFIRPLSGENAFADAHGLERPFVVLHAGNVGHSQDFETLLEAAALLEDEPDVLFLVVGDGDRKEDVVRAADERSLSNVRFLPFQPWSRVPQMLAASDVQLALLKPDLTSHSTPSKVYTAMASERPVVVAMDPESDPRQLVRETGSGIGIGPGDPEALAGTVRSLRKDAEGRRRMGRRGRRYAEERLSPAAVARRYEALLESVVA